MASADFRALLRRRARAYSTEKENAATAADIRQLRLGRNRRHALWDNVRWGNSPDNKNLS